jgi:PAS domain S-box-containing protein
MPGGRILLVEDSATQAEALRATLEGARFTVVHAESGEAAIAALDDGGFDLVVSDVMMPGISGYELCRIVKERPDTRGLPFVLLTSLNDPMAIVRGLECGADNYVTKPYTPSYLLARIRNTLDKYTLREGSKTSMGVNVRFLDTTFTITSDREQILDLFISSIEDVVRANEALQVSQRELSAAQQQLEKFASRMAHQAQVSAEKYSALMHSASDAIFVLDSEHRITEANARATELLGAPVEELRGRLLYELATPLSRDVLREHLMVLQGSDRTTAPDLEFRHPVLGYVYFDLAASRTATHDGELTLAILHDVTERRAAAERMRLSEAQLAKAQELAHLASFEFDALTGSINLSAELYRIFGRSREQVQHTVSALLECVHPDDREALQQAGRALLAGATIGAHECRIVRPDGAIRHVHVRAEVHLGDSGSAGRLLGTVQDVTDWKQLEQQLQQSQKMEAIGRLAGGIAHDFNNLLTVITSYSDLALAEVEPDSQLRADLTEIRRAAESAASLTGQLLAFSRKQVVQPRPLVVEEVLREFDKVLRRIVGEDVEFVVTPGEGDAQVLADRGQIEQVVMNLVVNARDAMPAGGRLTIETATVDLQPGHTLGIDLPPGGYRRLSVSDTGSGIEPRVMERIFEPFFTTKAPGQGTGLGLSTVHGIVKQLGGDVRVTTAPGAGTTFEVFLPIVTTDSGSSGPTPVPGLRRRGSETVLIVEDEPGLRALARRLLEAKGYTVLEARNGDEALEICESAGQRIDLVLTDVIMPGLNVRTMVERLSGSCAGVKVLFMSGYTDDDIMRSGLADPHVAFLQKPFTPQSLVAKVQEVLESGMSVAQQRAEAELTH